MEDPQRSPNLRPLGELSLVRGRIRGKCAQKMFARSSLRSDRRLPFSLRSGLHGKGPLRSGLPSTSPRRSGLRGASSPRSDSPRASSPKDTFAYSGLNSLRSAWEKFTPLSPSFSTRGGHDLGRGLRWTSWLKGLHYMRLFQKDAINADSNATGLLCHLSQRITNRWLPEHIELPRSDCCDPGIHRFHANVLPTF